MAEVTVDELRLALEAAYSWYRHALGVGHADWAADAADVERVRALIGEERARAIEEEARCGCRRDDEYVASVDASSVTIYVDPNAGDDARDGLSPSSCVRTIGRVCELQEAYGGSAQVDILFSASRDTRGSSG